MQENGIERKTQRDEGGVGGKRRETKEKQIGLVSNHINM